MGLVHTSGVELGRYRALASECNEVYSLNGKKCLYLDFDGKELGLANRLLSGAITTIHSRKVSTLDLCANTFLGRKNVSLKVYPRLDAGLIGEERYDILVWWRGPQTDDEFNFLESVKHLFSDLVIVGSNWEGMSRKEMSSFQLTEFLGLGLAFQRTSAKFKNPPIVNPVSHETKIVEPTKTEAPDPAPKKRAPRKPRKSTKKGLTGRDVTTGEMKTEQSSVLTDISSKSSLVQPSANPAKKKSSTDLPDAEAFIRKSNTSIKMETAFLLSGELPESVEDAEAMIRSASAKELSVVC